MSVPFYVEEIALLALLGGVLAVDERAGWQGLFAQPVVSGAIVGLLFGDFATGVAVGLALELVWLSVLPMRGTRRPDAVAGSVVGAGTACLLAHHTGDPRFAFVVGLGAVLGLVAGEIAGSAGRRLHRVRDRRLARFRPPDSTAAARRRLIWYSFYSVAFIFGAEVLMVAVMLPAAAVVADWLTAVGKASLETGSEWWVDLVPVLGAGALIQIYWHRQQYRYLVLSGAVVLMLLWML